MSLGLQRPKNILKRKAKFALNKLKYSKQIKKIIMPTRQNKLLVALNRNLNIKSLPEMSIVIPFDRN